MISASCSGRSSPLRIASRVPRTASGALRLTIDAISRARSSNRSCSTTSETSPSSYAALRAHALVPPGERDPHRDVGRQHAREAHHLTTRHQPDADVRIEELGLIRRDDDVAGGDPVEAGAAAQAVDRGENRLGHRAERRRPFLRRLPLRVGGEVRLVVDDAPVVGDVGDVGTCAERTPGTGDDRDPDVVVRLGRLRTPAAARGSSAGSAR